MPRVPEYDSLQVGQNALSPTPIHATPLQDIGAQHAQQLRHAQGGVGQLAGDAARINAQVQQIEAAAKADANKVRVNDALNAVVRQQHFLTYDKDAGFVNRKGEDVVKAGEKTGVSFVEQYSKDFDEFVTGIAKGLTPEQRAAFVDRADGIRNQYELGLMRHYAAEFRSHEASVDKATLTLAEKNAEKGYADPEALRGSLNAVSTATYSLGKNAGLSSDEIEENIKTARSGILKTAITAAVDNGAMEVARGLFEKNNEAMTKDDRHRVGGLLKAGDLKLRSQQESDSIYDKNPDDEVAALDSARKIKDPDLRDDVERRLVSRFVTDRRLKHENEEKIGEQMWRLLEENPSMDALPPSLLTALPHKYREAAKKYVADTQKTGKVETNWPLYNDMMDTFSARPQDILLQDMNVLRAHLGDPQYNALRNLRNEVLRKGVSSPEVLKEKEINEMITDYARGIKDQEDKGAFRLQARDAIERWSKNRGGKAPERDDLRAMLDGLKTKSLDVGWFWDSSGDPVYKMREKGKPFVANFSKEQIARFDAIREERGDLPIYDAKEKYEALLVFYRLKALDNAKKDASSDAGFSWNTDPSYLFPPYPSDIPEAPKGKP